jgi:hypothetical protein
MNPDIQQNVCAARHIMLHYHATGGRNVRGNTLKKQKTKYALLEEGIDSAAGSFANDCPVGARPSTRDRVCAPGTEVIQTRPGTLGYDL